MMEPPWIIQWIASVLNGLPSPTSAWADIVGHLVWPLALVFLIVRFRLYLKRILDTITSRMTTDDFKIGPFEMTANSQVLVLDPDGGQATALGDALDDIDHIDRLLEFIADVDGLAKLKMWVGDKVGTGVDMEDFVTEPTYASDRKDAVAALIQR